MKSFESRVFSPIYPVWRHSQFPTDICRHQCAQLTGLGSFPFHAYMTTCLGLTAIYSNDNFLRKWLFYPPNSCCFASAAGDLPKLSKGVFLVTTTNAIFPVDRDNSMNTDSWISTVPRGSERSEWASPWTEQASEASVAKRSAAERVSGASERT